MGKLINILMGNSNNLDEKSYRSFDHSNSSLNQKPELNLQIAEVSSKSDMLNVEQSIRSGDILIMEINRLHDSLTKEELLTYISNAVSEINGDIVKRHENEYIITPSSISINRSKL